MSHLPLENQYVALPDLRIEEYRPLPVTFFSQSNMEVLRFEHNGDLYHRGKLICEADEIVKALHDVFNSSFGGR